MRAFDNKYYSKAAVVGPIALKEPYHNEEFAFLKDVARAELKVPITGAYTIGDWSFDERYFTEHDLRVPHAERKALRKGGRRQLIVDVARNMIRPNLEALIGLGARWIQLDEPGGSTEPDELTCSPKASTRASLTWTRFFPPTCASPTTDCSSPGSRP